MTELFDIGRVRLAVLQNAFDVVEERRLNAVWSLTFSLPCDDPKNGLCGPYRYIRHDGGELYRILPASTVIEETGAVTYTCEHVLATLMDNILFGSHVVGNLGTYTADCIRYVLEHQLTKNWALGDCDFRRQFEYGWEQETLLSALFSIATPMTEPYRWATDTTTYPWKLSLRRIDTGRVPEMVIRRGKNMLSIQKDVDPAQLCTRLYPLGYGEGVNQLGIADVNGGVPYLQSPPEITAKYGIIERVWIDRRYENAESLKAAGQAMLNELQEPRVEYTVSFAQLGAASLDNAEIGKVAEIVDPGLGLRERSYITGMTLRHGDILSSELTVANTPQDIASSVADMADRQRIEMSYAQGATQLYAQSLQANADSKDGATVNFFIDAAMRIVNKVLIKVKLEPFRTYSKASSSNGGHDTTLRTKTQSQTVRTRTTSTTARTRSETVTIDTGDWAIGLSGRWDTDEPLGSCENHIHHVPYRLSFGFPSTEVDIPGQSFDVRIPSLDVDFTIPSQSIELKIPAHAHEITPGIYRFGSPKRFSLYVDGRYRAAFDAAGAEIDITGYLVGDGRTIARGAWHSVEVRPDDLAYVSVDMYVQGFVQSRGDMTV